MKSDFYAAIKKFEGYTPKAQWDYAQDSNGFGTRALFEGEVIDKVEAERRFALEIAQAKATVARFAPNLDEGSAAALTSLTFNAGTGWMKSGLGAAVKAGDLEAAKRAFLQYVNAGGQRLAGLEARRAIEVQWFGQAKPSGEHRGGLAAPSAVATAPSVRDRPSPRESAIAATVGNYSPANSPVSVATQTDRLLAHVLLLEAIRATVRRGRDSGESNEHARPLRV